MWVVVVLREGAHAELTLEDLFEEEYIDEDTGLELGKGPIVELTLEDLIILLVEETVFSDSKFEIFLLEPVCCVQLN